MSCATMPYAFIGAAIDAVDGSSTRHVSATDAGAPETPTIQRSALCKRSIGLDIAKSVFQVHGVDAAGQVVICQLKRRYVLGFFQKLPPCLIGIAACASCRIGIVASVARVSRNYDGLLR
jgi:hypothetical protein